MNCPYDTLRPRHLIVFTKLGMFQRENAVSLPANPAVNVLSRFVLPPLHGHRREPARTGYSMLSEIYWAGVTY